MKKLSSLSLAALLLLGFASCDKPNLEDKNGAYPRIQLIEHFTGADCGYCPGGMNDIYDVYKQNPDSFVWVSNHAGYYPDEYTIKGSNSIVNKLGVSGAPSVSLNRKKRAGSYNYHPADLAAVYRLAEHRATAKIDLESTYDAASGKLHVTIKGYTTDPELTEVKLTLGVTESGLIGRQADYDAVSFEGWSEFVHTHVIRLYATDPLGDQVTFEGKKFIADYDIQINKDWKADNCQIVAWITPAATFTPVINAAKLPVVKGTKGGEDIKHAGVTYQVSAYEYPEPDPRTKEPLSDVEMVAFAMKIDSTSSQEYNKVTFIAQSDKAVLDLGQGIYAYPYVQFYLYTTKSSTIPAGTYTISDKEAVGNVMQGWRDDVNYKLGGSIFAYVYQYNNRNNIYYQWFMNEGAITFAEDGSFTGNITTRRKQSIHFFYNAPTPEEPEEPETPSDDTNAPTQAPAKVLLQTPAQPLPMTPFELLSQAPAKPLTLAPWHFTLD